MIPRERSLIVVAEEMDSLFKRIQSAWLFYGDFYRECNRIAYNKNRYGFDYEDDFTCYPNVPFMSIRPITVDPKRAIERFKKARKEHL